MLKALLKSNIAYTLYYTGLLSAYGRSLFRDKAIILMYHRVLPRDDIQIPYVQPGMYVSVESFQKQIHFLKSHFKLISLEDLVRRLAERRSISRCCVLTFDDGWRDNFQYAYPILKKNSVPATIFLTAGYVDTKLWFWPEEVSLCLFKLVHGEAKIDNLPNVIQKEIDSNGLGLKFSLEKSVDRVIKLLKMTTPQKRINCVRQMKEACGIEEHDERLLVNWDEVREMGESGLIKFGSHTVNHVLLDQLSLAEAQHEIGRSLEIIEEKSSKKCGFFAYPNGNYNDNIITLLENAGATAALTTRRGYVTYDSSLLNLPRIAMHEDVSCNLPLFLWRLIVR